MSGGNWRCSSPGTRCQRGAGGIWEPRVCRIAGWKRAIREPGRLQSPDPCLQGAREFRSDFSHRRLYPLCDQGESRTTPLYVDHQSVNGEPHPLISVPVAYFPAWVVNSPDGRQALSDYMSRFPSRPVL